MEKISKFDNLDALTLSSCHLLELILFTHLSGFTLHIIICPCKEQCADMPISCLPLTIVPLNRLIEDNPSLFTLCFAGRLGAMMV